MCPAIEHWPHTRPSRCRTGSARKGWLLSVAPKLTTLPDRHPGRHCPAAGDQRRDAKRHNFGLRRRSGRILAGKPQHHGTPNGTFGLFRSLTARSRGVGRGHHLSLFVRPPVSLTLPSPRRIRITKSSGSMSTLQPTGRSRNGYRSGGVGTRVPRDWETQGTNRLAALAGARLVRRTSGMQ